MAAISLLQLGLLTSGLRAFVLPGSGSEAEQGTGLQEDIAAIFLGETLGARLGAGAGYSGAAEAGLGAEAEVVQQILRGTAALANTADSGPSLGSSSLTQATVETDTRHENCADYTEELGYSCVPYYQCSNGSIVTDGAGLIDIRNGFGALNPEASKCPGFLDVCCKDPAFVPPPAPAVKYAARCGRRNVEGVGARVSGFRAGEAQFGEWPGMCALLSGSTFQCGASLIDTGLVLTAAHCVDKFRDDVSSLVVRCGEWDTQHATEPYPHQEAAVAAVSIHPEFQARNLANDVAVLFMETEFRLDWNVDTVCLPQPGESFDGRSCFATGWGKDEFGDAGEFQVVLKEVELPTVPFDTCQASLRQTRLGSRFQLHSSFLCAGGNLTRWRRGRDTCQGDGGGPLLCPSPTSPATFTQAAITAWGIGCGGPSPGVYAALAEAVCWIDMVASCRASGGQTSHFGYFQETCGRWLEDTLARLQSLPARVRGVLEAGYTQCRVQYQSLYTDLSLDLSEFARIKNITGS